MPKTYWLSHVPSHDDFYDPIGDEFIDGKTRMGPWALMTPASFERNGMGKFGAGFGQRYRRDPNATEDHLRWPCVEGSCGG